MSRKIRATHDMIGLMHDNPYRVRWKHLGKRVHCQAYMRIHSVSIENEMVRSTICFPKQSKQKTKKVVAHGTDCVQRILYTPDDRQRVVSHYCLLRKLQAMEIAIKINYGAK